MNPDKRNTPTHVGKTRYACSWRLGGKKHPHARGEDLIARIPAAGQSETPPRTWGRRSDRAEVDGCVRNTPTHVGKTHQASPQPVRQRKHPHARGEDAMVRALWVLVSETPPRTWGRPADPRQRRQPDRNTPTHVGKTAKIANTQSWLWKHPHARGEDTATGLPAAGMAETPPRTWGRLHGPASQQRRLSNTPTHVGKTTRRLLLTTWCVETPPRTWGRLMGAPLRTPRRRNTPTHVGKTPDHLIFGGLVEKHPHARGEDRNGEKEAGAKRETPPRTWGRPQ